MSGLFSTQKPGSDETRVDAPSGAGGMPSTIGGVAPSGVDSPVPGVGAPVEQPRSKVVDAAMGALAEGPFALAALKTGNDHWLLAPSERALMSEAAGAVVESYGVQLNPKTNPWGCLALGYFAFGFPRLAEEIRLLRVEMAKKKAEAKAP